MFIVYDDKMKLYFRNTVQSNFSQHGIQLKIGIPEKKCYNVFRFVIVIVYSQQSLEQGMRENEVCRNRTFRE